jgi:hypothetical protein
MKQHHEKMKYSTRLPARIVQMVKGCMVFYGNGSWLWASATKSEEHIDAPSVIWEAQKGQLFSR